MSKDMCSICSGIMIPFFNKNFYGNLNLNIVEYIKCENCGFVISKTHKNMNIEEWELLNKSYHIVSQSQGCNADEPRWDERLTKQAEILSDLYKLDILPSQSPWIDYGCGDGQLSKKLLSSHGVGLLNYDEYMKGEGQLSKSELLENGFDLVICNALFEHVIDIQVLNDIEKLVSENGVLVIHTRISESIPEDPSWFYLLPVHCSFYTNKSMQILFDTWNYQASIYNEEARLWFLFKNKNELEEKIITENKKHNSIKYHYKKGFMDYWKTVG